MLQDEGVSVAAEWSLVCREGGYNVGEREEDGRLWALPSRIPVGGNGKVRRREGEAYQVEEAT